MERIDHDLLFRWFLDLRIDEEVFDATVFSHNRGRLEEHGLIGAFFDGTVRRAIAAGLVSPDHFSVDGSLIEAYASIKSFKPRDEKDKKDNDAGDNNGFKGRNAEVDFHGQKRSNDTHESTTDSDAKLVRKSDGKPALLSHALHAIVENRHGLVLAVEVNSPLENSEPVTALSLIDRVKKRFGLKPKTVGADKGYDQGPLLRGLERRRIRPHVAVKEGKIGGDTAAYRWKNRANIAARQRMRRCEDPRLRHQPALPQEDRGMDRLGQDDRRPVSHPVDRTFKNRPAGPPGRGGVQSDPDAQPEYRVKLNLGMQSANELERTEALGTIRDGTRH